MKSENPGEIRNIFSLFLSSLSLILSFFLSFLKLGKLKEVFSVHKERLKIKNFVSYEEKK